MRTILLIALILLTLLLDDKLHHMAKDMERLEALIVELHLRGPQ